MAEMHHWAVVGSQNVGLFYPALFADHIWWRPLCQKIPVYAPDEESTAEGSYFTTLRQE
jgi:hypothetical protein